ncbi:MAG: acetolactate decarboxylase [Flavobacterium sp.]|nr:acetolactate decarboxylase [Flavobacterium sp.]
MKILTLITLILLLACSCESKSQTFKNDVTIVGAMKNVMWKGELEGNINLDTIANKNHLFGLGPVEYLIGEILIVDGKSYRSTVVSETEMKVEETYNIKAPFFGYANIANWKQQNLPKRIRTIKDLEQYLDEISNSSSRPFMFKLTGMIDNAKIHIVNLPKGSKVSSPDEAHKGQINYQIENERADIIGFFSKEHKAIFTHHDTFLHMHLITSDRQKMGHLDEVTFRPEVVKLYLPKE